MADSQTKRARAFLPPPNPLTSIIRTGNKLVAEKIARRISSVALHGPLDVIENFAALEIARALDAASARSTSQTVTTAIEVARPEALS